MFVQITKFIAIVAGVVKQYSTCSLALAILGSTLAAASTSKLPSNGTLFYPESKVNPNNADLKMGIKADTKLIPFDLDKLKLKPRFLEVASPLYQKVRLYEGYDLCEIFKAQGINLEKKDLVLFVAKDGFISRISAALILKYCPLLVYRDTTQPKGINWGTVISSNTTTDGGPYYLMWGNNAKEEVGENDWPFGVTHFSFVVFQDEFKDAVPTAPKYVRGFKIFSKNCANCHTVRGAAPDYTDKTTETNAKGEPSIRGPSFSDLIKAGRTLKQMEDYAANPQAIYPKARMPPQHLKRSEIKEAIEYALYLNIKLDM